MDGVRAVLIDIDGVLTVSWKPLPGAVEAVRALREADVPFALVTNTTSRTRARIAEDPGRRRLPRRARRRRRCPRRHGRPPA